MNDRHEHDDEYDDRYDELDDEYVTIKVGREGLRRWVAVALAVVVLLAAIAGGAAWWLSRQIDPPGPSGEPISLEVPQGSTSDQIGTLLEEHDVITSAAIWRWYLRVNGGGPFQAGVYEVPTNSAMGEVVDILEAGPLPPESLAVTVPEAFTISQIVERLADPDQGVPRFEADELRELLATNAVTSRTKPPEVDSMEGLLFPDTYQVDEDETGQMLLQRMADQLDAVLDAVGADEVAPSLGRTRYEIVIIASLIEEEARVPGDRAKISRVIHNRLAQGIPLGIDATSRYEAELMGRDRDDIDFESDSPFNTRRNAGLPPTPIAAPGREAIEAALAPADGPWIFYVLADEEGNHFFTDSEQEFLDAKAECEAKGLGCG